MRDEYLTVGNGMYSIPVPQGILKAVHHQCPAKLEISRIQTFLLLKGFVEVSWWRETKPLFSAPQDEDGRLGRSSMSRLKIVS